MLNLYNSFNVITMGNFQIDVLMMVGRDTKRKLVVCTVICNQQHHLKYLQAVSNK